MKVCYSGLLFVVLACSPEVEAVCQQSAKAFPPNMEGKSMKFANLFDIDYYVLGTGEHYKVITFSKALATYKSSHPKKGQPVPQIVLYQCGTSPPTQSSTGVTTPGARFFEIPLKKASLPWAGPLPFFEMLSVTEAIQLMDVSYANSPCGQLMEVCSPGKHLSAYDSKWKATSSADGAAVFTDSFGTGFSNSSADVEFMISVDPGIMHRFEWIKFVAAFFNEEDKANQIFTKVQTDYNALKAQALKLRGNNPQPLAIWVNSELQTCPSPATNCVGKSGYIQVDGNWCICGNSYSISNAHYKREIVEDAGGRLVSMPATAPTGCSMSTNTDGSQTLKCKAAGFKAYKDLMAMADIIIDESYIDKYDTNAHDFAGTFDVTAAEVPAVGRNPPAIFRLDGTISDDYSGSIGSAWFNLMPAHPQQLLADMMEAFYSAGFDSPCGASFIRRAVRGKGQTVLRHHDCPMYDAGGNHNCAGLKDYERSIPMCMPQTTTKSAPSTTSKVTKSAPSTTSKVKTQSGVTGPSEATSGAVTGGLSLAFLLLPLCLP